MWLLNLDEKITFWLYQGERLGTEAERVLYTAASAFVYVLPVIVLYLFFHSHRDRVNSIKLVIATLFSWKVLSSLLGYWLYSNYAFRDRPFSHYGIQELFLEQPQKAFPSDHAAVLLTATLCFFYFKYPKLGWLFLVLGVGVSSVSRVAIGFHWFGDVLGGWAIALITFGLLRLFDRPLGHVIERGIGLLSKKRGNGRI